MQEAIADGAVLCSALSVWDRMWKRWREKIGRSKSESGSREEEERRREGIHQ